VGGGAVVAEKQSMRLLLHWSLLLCVAMAVAK
jgi:hypothetical protein